MLTTLFVGWVALRFSVAAEFPTGGFQVNEQWRPMRLDDLLVQSGTALDSSFLNDVPAGKYGQVIVNRNGQLAFSARPGEPVRFFCNNENMPHLPHRTDEDIEAYAEQTARAGYNVWRPHSVDSFDVRSHALLWNRGGRVAPLARRAMVCQEGPQPVGYGQRTTSCV